MPKIILCCLAAQLLAAPVLCASEDLFAAPLFSHTKFELPEPYKNGEIVAKAHLKDVGEAEKVVELSSLKVTIGTTDIDVPRGVLDLFPGANLTTLRFFVGPPDNPDFPIHSEKPKPGEPAYFAVTYLFGLWPSNPGVNSDNETTAIIIFKEGKVIELSSSWYERKEGGGIYHTRSYDPTTLKEIPRDNPEETAAKAGNDEAAKP